MVTALVLKAGSASIVMIENVQIIYMANSAIKRVNVTETIPKCVIRTTVDATVRLAGAAAYVIDHVPC